MGHAEGAEALGVTVGFTIDVFEVDGEGGRGAPVSRLECRYAALYACDLTPPPQAAEVDAFARTVAVLALYPYAQAAIQDTMARMGLPPLTMGVYRIPFDDPEPSVPALRETTAFVEFCTSLEGEIVRTCDDDDRGRPAGYPCAGAAAPVHGGAEG